MLIRLIIVLCIALWAIAGCSGLSSVTDREVSGAANAEEVVATWDTVCASFNFDECPANVLSELCTTTVGDMYSGSNFSSDSEGITVAMKDELDLILNPVPPINDDLINAVVEDEVWLEE